MSGFLWASGHLGWGIFALAVFSCVWLLLSDLVWRLRSAAIIRLASAIAYSAVRLFARRQGCAHTAS